MKYKNLGSPPFCCRPPHIVLLIAKNLIDQLFKIQILGSTPLCCAPQQSAPHPVHGVQTLPSRCRCAGSSDVLRCCQMFLREPSRCKCRSSSDIHRCSQMFSRRLSRCRCKYTDSSDLRIPRCKTGLNLTSRSHRQVKLRITRYTHNNLYESCSFPRKDPVLRLADMRLIHRKDPVMPLVCQLIRMSTKSYVNYVSLIRHLILMSTYINCIITTCDLQVPKFARLLL